MYQPLKGTMPGRKRGASLLSYGLVVGLISVVALAAVTGTGSSANSLFVNVADTLEGTATGGSSGASSGGSGSAPDAGPCGTAPQSFASSGTTTLNPPIGCETATIKMWGGGGMWGLSGDDSFGGAGAYVGGTLTGLTNSDSLELIVAEFGSVRGAGGGASYVNLNGSPMLVAAGGGGGGGHGSHSAGGAGGGGGDTSTAQDGLGRSSGGRVANGGAGATSSGGGAGGTATNTSTEGTCQGDPGGVNAGGDRVQASNSGAICTYSGAVSMGTSTATNHVSNGAGGGGGGGYYGGGGGGAVYTYTGGGGGGGISFIDSAVSGGTADAADRETPGNDADPDRAGAGKGGDYIGPWHSRTFSNPTGGLILITWGDG
ncbi:MAG: hypothetical protein Alpg2KO_09960 [Alphaproteobacteria bacterium]